MNKTLGITFPETISQDYLSGNNLENPPNLEKIPVQTE
jgi:hypothetical protein